MNSNYQSANDRIGGDQKKAKGEDNNKGTRDKKKSKEKPQGE